MAAALVREARTSLLKARVRIVVQFSAASILLKVAFSKDAFPKRWTILSDQPSQTPAMSRQ